MSGWEFDKSSKGDKKETKYTKFAPGVTKIRILDDAPEVKWIHWMPKFNKAINCPGKGCPICDIRRQQKANGQPASYNMSRRLMLNVFNYDTNQVELMEQGVTFFEDLRDIKEDIVNKGKTLQDAVIRVRRRGSGKDDTSYRIDIEEIDPLSKDDLTKWQPSILDLKEITQPNTIEQILDLLNGKEWEDVFSRDKEESSEEEDTEEKDFTLK